MASITTIDVSVNETEEEQLKSQDYNKINVDLNKGAGGKSVYLWYKREKEARAITRLQVSFNEEMEAGLAFSKYMKINKDLNAGTGEDSIYLWYFHGSGNFDTPIVELDVTTTAEDEVKKFRNGWERLACDLNRNAGGDWIHAWVKRETPTFICDITATNSYRTDSDNFDKGFIRVDDYTNWGDSRSKVFIWYRQTTNKKKALTGLGISIDDVQEGALQAEGYEKVSVTLNDGSTAHPVYLWHKKKKEESPVSAVTLLRGPRAVHTYQEAGFLIKKNLNSGNSGYEVFLGVKQ